MPIDASTDTNITTDDTSANAVTGSIAVLTHHNDNACTGANLNETTLTTANVKPGTFGKLCDRQVDGQIYAQILYVNNVNIPGKGRHNVVYVATMANSVYAYDADDRSKTAQPLWKVTLHPAISLPDSGIAGGPGYNDIALEVGILSTPVISLENNTIYVVAATKTNETYAHFLHALDLGTGQDKLSPVEIQASYPGHGYDKDIIVDGNVTFISNCQIQRPALLLANGNIYIGFAAYEDTDPYHGWLLAYDAQTLEQTAVYNTTGNGGQGGIWQAGQGPAADSDGNIYVMTGNGTTTTDGDCLGDSVIKLDPQLNVLDWFIPYNFQALSNSDNDVGSSGPMLLPGTNFLVGGGKEGKFFLLDKNKLGKFVDDKNNNSQILQCFYVILPDDVTRPYTMDFGKTHHIHGGPVTWTGPMGQWIYIWAEDDVLKAFQFKNGRFITTTVGPKQAGQVTKQSDPPGTGGHPITFPGGNLGALASKAQNVAQGDWIAMPGGAVSISANGNKAGTGIIWASHPHNQGNGIDANQHIVQGMLRAYDAANLGRELWNSEMDKTGNDRIGNFAKFNPPTIANGKVYLASFGSVFPLPQNKDLKQADRDKIRATFHFSIYGLK